MDSGKAPGLDCYTVGFFKKTWSIVGNDLCAAVIQFFDSFFLPHWINATSLTLIHKLASPAGSADYQPISCRNVVYKCISKVLANRLSTWLPSFISLN